MADARLITIAPHAAAAMRAHAEATYPDEACGAIFGTGDGASEPWAIDHTEPAPNDHDGDHRVRYLVSPAFQAAAERRALASGLDVIGFYHSHPEDLARPSEYDRSHAWVGYVYPIFSVRSGRAVDVNAFTLSEQDGIFLPVPIDPVPSFDPQEG
jgi:proteasome lid subunit RPN8/RPN11